MPKINKMSKNFIKYGIENSLHQVYKYGRRSPHRVKYIHYWIRNYVQNKLGDDYKCYSHNPLNKNDDKEIKVNGKFYAKNSDITICNNKDKILGVISVKFILSNYKQNANNYFESMIGECYNLQANKVKYGHIMICPYKIPYYDISSNVKKIETIKNEDIIKYTELNNSDIKYKPNMLSFNILKFNTEDGTIPNPDLFVKMGEKKQIEISNSINDKCKFLSNKEIKNYFNEENSKYLRKNTIIKSLDNYMKEIEINNQEYKNIENNSTDNIKINNKSSKIKFSLFDKIKKKFNK